jgi:tetrapyrrole methylase family protein/MazG family protein
MSPGGCPWDMAQTHESLKPNLLEETYEALDALDALSIEDDIPREKKLAKLTDELGDLLGQILYQTYIAERDGEFTLNDVAATVATKLVRRHPHVFAGKEISGVDDALKNWEEIKKAERATEGGDNSVSAGLRGIPAAMPALQYAQQVQGRVKRTGYQWPNRAELIADLRGKLTVLTQGSSPDAPTIIGDLLWQMVSLARDYEVNAEDALRLAVRKFVAAYQGLPLTLLNLAADQSVSLRFSVEPNPLAVRISA